MKTIFISVNLGTAIRNILRTEVLKNLSNNNKIVILSPFSGTGLLDEFCQENILQEHIDLYDFGFAEKALYYITKSIFERLNSTETRRLQLDELKSIKYTEYLKRILPRKLAPPSGCFMNLCNDLLLKMSLRQEERYEKLFNKYKPDVLVSTYAYNFQYDYPLIKYCQKHEIPVVVVNLSWDNLTSKGKIPIGFNRIIVWNEIQQREAHDLYRFCYDIDICVAGLPHYDQYHTNESIINREDFFKIVGLDTNKRLITYTTSAHRLAPYENEIIEQLADCIKANTFEIPVQLLVRRAPRDSWEHYENIRLRNDIFFNEPGNTYSLINDRWNPNEKDMIFYANLLYNSDIIINVASTVTIDAAIFDTPIINIAYDGGHDIPFHRSVKHHYATSHYKNIVATGGVSLANSFEELIKYIEQYLNHPEMNKEGRQNIIETQCYKLDGKACERITQFILDVC